MSFTKNNRSLPDTRIAANRTGMFIAMREQKYITLRLI